MSETTKTGADRRPLSPSMSQHLIRMLSKHRRDGATWQDVGAGRNELDKRTIDALARRLLVDVDRHLGVARLTKAGISAARSELEAFERVEAENARHRSEVTR